MNKAISAFYCHGEKIAHNLDEWYKREPDTNALRGILLLYVGCLFVLGFILLPFKRKANDSQRKV